MKIIDEIVEDIEKTPDTWKLVCDRMGDISFQNENLDIRITSIDWYFWDYSLRVRGVRIDLSIWQKFILRCAYKDWINNISIKKVEE